ncbi:PepSY-like domain-containing protein [Dyadobacter sp. NIV53]|uniref:PepSY-like domain-containing protein n=1 Tax=Dyadobacter sp. NIV53 TaxID=2861765 RepID=UPI001C86AA88|nr:PepSY-like domain-containing protein [Dyadobacter sp. NIV53]
MKKIIFLAASLFYSVMSFAQEIQAGEVPSIVLNTFKQKFLKAADVEWKLKNQLYNVEFEIGRVDHEAWISNNGSIVKHKQDIQTNELPGAVSESISRNYKGFRIDDAEKIEAGEKLLYKVELKTASKEEDVVFDHNGKLVESY